MAAKLASAPKEREPRVDEPPRSKPPGSGLLYAKHVVEMFRGAFVAAAVIGVVFAVNWCVVKRKRATEETKQLELISERNLPVPDDIIENR